MKMKNVQTAQENNFKLVYSNKQWGELAEALAANSIVIIPELNKSVNNLLLEDDVDDEFESQHRKASGLSLCKHWESIGYVLSRSDIEKLTSLDITAHAWIHKNVTPSLVKTLGGHRHMRPMYPNFPQQVMEMSDAQLYMDALLAEAAQELGLPSISNAPEEERAKGSGKDTKKRQLKLMDITQLKEYFNTLMNSNTVWPPDLKSLAVKAMPLIQHWQLFGSNTFLPQRENQAYMTSEWLKLLADKKIDGETAQWPASRVSATDILRALVAYNGGDASLSSSSEKVKFKNLSRPMRRVIMKALERASVESKDVLVDLHMYRQKWLRLAETLHAGEWGKKTPAAFDSIQKLRNEDAPITFGSKLDAILDKPATAESVNSLVSLFEENPGYSARSMMRSLLWASQVKNDFSKELINGFAKVAPLVDTPVLLSLYAASNNASSTERLMIPKGSVAKRYKASRDKSLQYNHARDLMDVCQKTLEDRFSVLPKMGNVYIDSAVEEVLVPKGLRDASGDVGVVTRGSQLPVSEDANVLRMFLWWKGGFDVDVSVAGYSEAGVSIENCNYHNLKARGMVHSGDIRHAEKGAAEYIDIKLSEINPQIRYIALTANSFSGPEFSDMDECFVGWQEREDGQSGKLMDISTVANKFKVTCKTKGIASVLFDVVERKVQWLDVPLNIASGVSVSSYSNKLIELNNDFKLYAQNQPKVSDLIKMHVTARQGNLVDDVEKADLIYSVADRVVVKNDKELVLVDRPEQVASSLMISLAQIKKDAKNEADETSQIGFEENPLNVLNAKKTDEKVQVVSRKARKKP